MKIGYVESVRSMQFKVLTPAIFDKLTQSKRVWQLIKDYRSGANKSGKQMLPAFIFQGWNPNCENTNGEACGRKAENLVPTGLFMMDFDHVSDTAELYERVCEELPKVGYRMSEDVALIHITPSGKGLRLVLRRREGEIEDEQRRVAEALGVECDAHVKDLSRLSFCPKSEDILFRNDALLFSNEVSIKSQSEPVGSFPFEGGSGAASGVGSGVDGSGADCSGIGSGAASGVDGSGADCSGIGSGAASGVGSGADCSGADCSGIGSGAASGVGSGADGSGADGSGVGSAVDVSGAAGSGSQSEPVGSFPLRVKNENAAMLPAMLPTIATVYKYKGRELRYSDIVKGLVEELGGEPEQGNRNNMVFMLASDLAKITDRNEDILKQIIPMYGLPKAEWEATIQAQAKKKQMTRVSKKLRTVLDKLYDEEEARTVIAETIEMTEESEPPAMPARLPRLIKLLTSKVLDFQKPAVSIMCFPALAAHVNDARFLMADNRATELSMMSVLLGKQSIGKSCVTDVIKHINADIQQADHANRQREYEWAERNRNRKANEKGESRPSDLVIRILNSDTTPAAFLGRLSAAQTGDARHQNYSTYSHVEEIEELYNFCSQAGVRRVRQMIKAAWDRTVIGAERWSLNAANISTVLRWNWTAMSTITQGKRFFSTSLVDGTLSRVDFCTMVPPRGRVQFVYGTYDAEFVSALAPYIENLNRFECDKDENGERRGLFVQRLHDLEVEMNEHINTTADLMTDSNWESYAWRTKLSALKKAIVLYIANGCEWEDEIEDFVKWAFEYMMWCKVNMFADAADAEFENEHIKSKGQASPLKQMKREFSYAEFAAECQKNRVKSSVCRMIARYVYRGVITKVAENRWRINDEYYRKFGGVKG